MKFKITILIVLLLLIQIISCKNENKIKHSINYAPGNYEVILKKSKNENKKVFLYFYADWCGYCKYMKENVLNSKEITNYINKIFIPISVNAKNNENNVLRKKYNIISYPTFLFLNPDGSEIERFSGKSEKKQFLKRVKEISKNKNTLESQIKKFDKNPYNINLAFRIFKKYSKRGDIKNLILYKNKLQETDINFYIRYKEEILLIISEAYKRNNNYILAKKYNDILLNEEILKIKSRLIYNAECLTQLKKLDEVYRIYTSLISLMPDDINSYINLAKFSYSNKFLIHESINLAEKGLDIKTDNELISDLLFHIAQNYELINNNKKALELINNSLNINKDKKLIFYKIELENKIYGHSKNPKKEKLKIFPNEWDFGIIEKGRIISNEIFLINYTKEKMNIDIINTCDCLEVSNKTINILPNNIEIINITYNSKDDDKNITREIIIKENNQNIKIFYKIKGFVEDKTGKNKIINNNIKLIKTNNNKTNDIEIFYYYVPSCHLCQDFINKKIPSLEKKLKININLIPKDIYDDNNYFEYQEKLKNLYVEERKIPILIINKDVLQGNMEIDNNIEDYIKKYIKGLNTDKSIRNKKNNVEITKEFSLLLALSTGIIDGINPCAFAALISLLIALTLAGRRRKEIFFMGIFFTIAVYTTYYLVGVGIFEGFKLLSTYNIAAQIIKWIMIVFLFIMAILSIYDFYLIQKGRSNDIILQLPNFFKKRIKNTIKNNVRSTAIILSSITLGFLIALFELGCTGQIYLPFVIHLVRTEKSLGGFLLLGVYNLAFVTPLIIIFILTYFGLSSQKLTTFFQKQIGTIKILLACIFITLAVVTIFF